MLASTADIARSLTPPRPHWNPLFLFFLRPPTTRPQRSRCPSHCSRRPPAESGWSLVYTAPRLGSMSPAARPAGVIVLITMPRTTGSVQSQEDSNSPRRRRLVVESSDNWPFERQPVIYVDRRDMRRLASVVTSGMRSGCVNVHDHIRFVGRLASRYVRQIRDSPTIRWIDESITPKCKWLDPPSVRYFTNSLGLSKQHNTLTVIPIIPCTDTNPTSYRNIFHPCIFDGADNSSLAFSVAPLKRPYLSSLMTATL